MDNITEFLNKLLNIGRTGALDDIIPSGQRGWQDDPVAQPQAIDFSGLPDKATGSPINAPGTPDLGPDGAAAAYISPV